MCNNGSESGIKAVQLQIRWPGRLTETTTQGKQVETTHSGDDTSGVKAPPKGQGGKKSVVPLTSRQKTGLNEMSGHMFPPGEYNTCALCDVTN